MTRPVAAVGTLTRRAVHPRTLVVNSKKPLIRIERRAIDGTEIVPDVAIRIHTVLDLVH
jgi:hypothetical protein